MFLFCGFAILKEGQEKLMCDGYMQLKGFSFLILSIPRRGEVDIDCSSVLFLS